MIQSFYSLFVGKSVPEHSNEYVTLLMCDRSFEWVQKLVSKQSSGNSSFVCRFQFKYFHSFFYFFFFVEIDSTSCCVLLSLLSVFDLLICVNSNWINTKCRLVKFKLHNVNWNKPSEHYIWLSKSMWLISLWTNSMCRQTQSIDHDKRNEFNQKGHFQYVPFPIYIQLCVLHNE